MSDREPGRGEPDLRTSRGRSREGPGKVAVAEQLQNRRDERLCLRRRNEKTRGLIVQEIGNAANPCRDDRAPCSHRFDDRERRAFAFRARHQHVQIGVDAWQIVPPACKRHARHHAEPPGQGSNHVPDLAVPHHHEVHVRTNREHGNGGVEEQPVVLDWASAGPRFPPAAPPGRLRVRGEARLAPAGSAASAPCRDRARRC